uniref:Glycosyl-hydrolase family 116 N-terminal domain-containing protein n=1 Tax=Aegilops tauschii TaxID=37682 RepID=M8AIT3_AEGTA
MGSAGLEQTKARSHINCAQPATRTWQRKFDDEGKKIQLFSMTMNDKISIIPLILKGLMVNADQMGKGRDVSYDPFRKWMDNCYRGLPLGGLGKHWEKLQRAFVSRPNGKSYSTVLSAPTADALKGVDKATIGSWDWKLKERNCTYHALFPRSWTVYDGEPDPEIKITCRQISPIIPHNYKESSFPVAVFTFTVQNSGSTPADVTLLFTERDGVRGVLLRHRTADGHPPVTFAIASQETEDVRVTDCLLFTMGSSESGDFTAKDMWEEIKQHGSFSTGREPRASEPGSSIGAAVAAATTVPAGGSRVVSFALSWSCPEVKFTDGKTYHRLCGTGGTPSSVAWIETLLQQAWHDALLEHMEWESKIQEWQRPILQDKRLPEWYPVALFNELYYLIAGGTIWTE